MSIIGILLSLRVGTSSNDEKLIIDGISYLNDPGYQSSPTLMQQGLAGYQWSPIIWTVLDKTFISLSDNSNPNKYYITIYDHYRGKVSDPIDTGLVAETQNDVHHISSIINTLDTKILITETSLHGGAGNWKHSLTGGNYNMVFDAWTDSTIDEVTYHQLKRMSNGDIYNPVRLASAISGNYGYTDLYKSTNNGVSFSYVTRISSLDQPVTSDRYTPYHNLIYSTDDVLRLYINVYHTTVPGVPVDFKTTYYLESHDYGTTWQNVDNSASKDVVTNGPLTQSELDSDFVMWSLAASDGFIRVLHGELINNIPYFVGGSGTLSNSPLALYYWNGSAWVQNLITCAGHTILSQANGSNPYDINNGIGLFKNGSDIDLICSEDVSGLSQMSRFRTSNNGGSWSFVEQLTTSTANSGHLNAQINKNLQSVDYKVAACCEQIGGNNILFVKEI